MYIQFAHFDTLIFEIHWQIPEIYKASDKYIACESNVKNDAAA